jgi:hypothetical protein
LPTLDDKQQFFWGILGSLAPYAVRAARALTPDGALPHLGWGFLLASAALIVFGGVWSMAVESDKRWLAMYHGATFPIVFSFLFSHGSHSADAG